MRLNLDAINFSRFAIRDRDNEGRTIPFALNPPQIYLHSELQKLSDAGKPLWAIVLKARRVGISTDCAILNAVHCIAFPNASAMTVAHRAKNARAVFREARSAHETICHELGLSIEELRTQHELRFPHEEGESSFTLATAKTVEGARGLTLTALHLSEAAFYEQAEDAFTALISTVPYRSDSMILIESTANGRVGAGETFYSYWQDAVAGENQFTPIFISWLMDPGCRMDPETVGLKSTDLNKHEKELRDKFGADLWQLAWRRWAIPNRCVAAGSRVGTTDGIIPIQDAETAQSTGEARIIGWVNQGIKPILRLTTENGYSLCATEDHRIKDADGEWRQLRDLRVKDRIALMVPQTAVNPFILSSHGKGLGTFHLVVDHTVARFLGYFMGDGSWQNRGKGATCEITCDGQDEDTARDAAQTLEELFGSTARIYERRGFKHNGDQTAGALRVQIAGTWYEKSFQQWGLLAGTDRLSLHRQVCVPEAIWRSPLPIIKSFLSALFESDGCAAEGEVIFSAGREYGDLARDVHLLLLACGIPSQLKQLANAWRAWHVRIRGTATEKFFDDIGFRSARKQAKRPLRSSQGRQPTAFSLVDTVIAINQDGLAETFDISVESTNRFSAGGIEVHNCQGYDDKFLQEYPHTPEVSFLTSGDPAFTPEEMALAEKSLRKPAFMGSIEARKEGL